VKIIANDYTIDTDEIIAEIHDIDKNTNIDYDV